MSICQVNSGKMHVHPYIVLAQPSLFDPSRAPEDMHTAWAYCHVPHGSGQNLTDLIENTIENYAPGFRETILERRTMTAVDMELHNPNYVGGDINGGIQDLRQLFARPVFSFSPYKTSQKNVYICSSSTPPGGWCSWYVWLPRSEKYK